MTLLTDKQLKHLSKVANLGMKSTVTIKRRSTTTSVLEDAVEGWTTVSTSIGWVRALPSDDYSIDGGGFRVGVTHRLFVPLDTDLRPHDQVVIASKTYQVIDTALENTWKVLLRCSLRKGE